MIPSHKSIGILGALGLAASGIIGGRLLVDNKQERLLKRLDYAEKKYHDTMAKRAASPEVAAAEAKRLRKAEKLKRLEQK